MKKILLLTASPTAGGNGDTLMEAAAEVARGCGAQVKRHVQLIVDLPSIQRSVQAERTAVFTHCGSADTCRKTPAYLERARSIARWICE